MSYMKGHNIPEALIKEVIDKAKNGGHSINALAKKYGFSPSVISRYRYLKGIIKRQHRSLTDSQIREVRDRYIKHGETGPKIAKAMGISHTYVYEIVGKGMKKRSVAYRLEQSLKWEGKRLGRDNPNYRHGKGHVYHRSSFFLEEWKKQVRKRDRVCMMCGRGKTLEAHHIIAFSDERTEENPLLLVSLDNGILLCRSHHQMTAHREREFEEKCKKLLSKADKRGNS